MRSQAGKIRIPLLGWVALVVIVGLVTVMLLPHSGKVVRVSHDNPKLEAAIMEAKKQLPSFFDRLAKAQPRERFAVKVKFKTETEPEYLWCKDPMLKGSQIEAIVDQPPIALPKLKRGDTVTVPTEDVVDWLIKNTDGHMEGGFTDQALSR